MRLIDLTGRRFGYLTVIKRRGSRGSFAAWECRCDCGVMKVVGGRELRIGHTKSCGCFRRAFSTKKNRKHGRFGTPIYRSWASMVYRCTNPSSSCYHNYGGRGINVCSRWRSFENFLADMGERPRGRSLERIDNDGNYEPGNCRWATAGEQATNQRRVRLLETSHGMLSKTQIAKIAGVTPCCIKHRIRRGILGDDLLLPKNATLKRRPCTTS
jgi:hypothetical protein